jgi:hypothetical protein
MKSDASGGDNVMQRHAVESKSVVNARELTEQLFETSSSIVDFLGKCQKSRLERLFSSMLPVQRDALLSDLLRYYRPWPEWTLRILVEVLSVWLPTVPKQQIRECVQFIHFLCFELRLDGSTPRNLIIPPHLDIKFLGSVVGHLIAISEKGRRDVARLADNRAISPTEFAHFQKELATSELVLVLGEYLRVRPDIDLAAFSKALAEAKKKTFDSHGRPKDTTATEIYNTILANWPDIENMSGPSELCAFLEPVLKGSANDPEMKLDRVKKICARMGITFRPVVKGQPSPLPMSLSEPG